MVNGAKNAKRSGHIQVMNAERNIAGLMNRHTVLPNEVQKTVVAQHMPRRPS
jgi:hypothetical protein